MELIQFLFWDAFAAMGTFGMCVARDRRDDQCLWQVLFFLEVLTLGLGLLLLPLARLGFTASF